MTPEQKAQIERSEVATIKSMTVEELRDRLKMIDDVIKGWKIRRDITLQQKLYLDMRALEFEVIKKGVNPNA